MAVATIANIKTVVELRISPAACKPETVVERPRAVRKQPAVRKAHAARKQINVVSRILLK